MIECDIKSIPEPKKIIGFEVGTDFKLADWRSICSYFNILSYVSERVKIVDIGESTLGKPFFMAVISSAQNLAAIDELKSINKKLADSRGLSKGEIAFATEVGKPIVFIGCAQHSDEVAATQMSMQLAYDLISGSDEQTQRILDEVIIILVPSLNPDGHDIICQWYEQIKGTPFEMKETMPWLYHKYVGHNINRDWFMSSQVETRTINNLLYNEWHPLLVYDVHQMEYNGPRIFLPPYYDPVNPNLDPLLIRKLNVLAGHATVDLTKAGVTGIATNHFFELWRGMGGRSVPLRHNAMGILSEAASAYLASPRTVKEEEFFFESKGMHGGDKQMNYLEPWTGGCWRISDIIRCELIIAKAFLKEIAANKKEYLADFALLAQRQVSKGLEQKPFAYVIPSDCQRDFPEALEMMKVLMVGGVEVFEANCEFYADGRKFTKGSFIVPMAQPYRAFAKDLLETKEFPFLKTIFGTPELPRDEIAWTLPLQMHVECVEVNESFGVEMSRLSADRLLPTIFHGTAAKYTLFRNRTNNEALLINRLLKRNAKLQYLVNEETIEGVQFPAGTVVLSNDCVNIEEIRALSKNLGVDIYFVDTVPLTILKGISNYRLAIYQSWKANMQEGWMRWVLDQYGMDYTLLHNDQIVSKEVLCNFSHIIIPEMSLSSLLNGYKEGEIFPEFTGGIGFEGVEALKDFTRNGGRLITIGRSVDLATQHFNLPVRNLINADELTKMFENPADHSADEINRLFYCPGGLVNVYINDKCTYGYGFNPSGIVFNYFSPVFEVSEGTIIAEFPESNIISSGTLLNEHHIASKAAAVSCSYGNGEVVLFGFDPIHRAQSRGTFKFLFNSILY